MIKPEQLVLQIIRPSIGLVAMHSPEAEKLLLCTAVLESNCGQYIKQWPTGPACGIFQMEPATYQDIWENYVRYRSELAETLTQIFKYKPPAKAMIWNLQLAAIMCRLHYRRVKEPLPQLHDLKGFAEYHKKHYNTAKGKTYVAHSMIKLERFFEQI